MDSSAQPNTPFSLAFQVRDYELDLLGMVNNGVYQGYLEHARHEFLKSLGIDFAQMNDQGLRLVVVRAEIDYKQTLHSGDSFTVSVTLNRESKVRFCFDQTIVHSSGKLIVNAKILGTCLKQNGRPCFPPAWESLFPNR